MRPVGGILVSYIGVRLILTSSLALNAAGCFLLALATSMPLATAGILMVGTGCGLPYAAVFTTAAAHAPGRAASAMGLVNMLGIMMILVGAPAVGRIADASGSFRSSFLALGVFSVAAVAAALMIRSHEPHRSV
jgi:MFS family permease